MNSKNISLNDKPFNFFGYYVFLLSNVKGKITSVSNSKKNNDYFYIENYNFSSNEVLINVQEDSAQSKI